MDGGKGRPGGRARWETRREGTVDQEGGDGRPGGRGRDTRREGKGDKEGRTGDQEGEDVWKIEKYMFTVYAGIHERLDII